MTDLDDKSFDLAERVAELCRYLCDEKEETDISKLLLKSGTSVRTNIQEAMLAQNNEDYLSKMFTALTDAIETSYWTDRLRVTGYISPAQKDRVWGVCKEIEDTLVSITMQPRQYGSSDSGAKAEA